MRPRGSPSCLPRRLRPPRRPRHPPCRPLRPRCQVRMGGSWDIPEIGVSLGLGTPNGASHPGAWCHPLVPLQTSARRPRRCPGLRPPSPSPLGSRVGGEGPGVGDGEGEWGQGQGRVQGAWRWGWRVQGPWGQGQGGCRDHGDKDREGAGSGDMGSVAGDGDGLHRPGVQQPWEGCRHRGNGVGWPRARGQRGDCFSRAGWLRVGLGCVPPPRGRLSWLLLAPGSHPDQEAHQDQIPAARLQLDGAEAQPDQRDGVQRAGRRAGAGGERGAAAAWRGSG